MLYIYTCTIGYSRVADLGTSLASSSLLHESNVPFRSLVVCVRFVHSFLYLYSIRDAFFRARIAAGCATVAFDLWRWFQLERVVGDFKAIGLQQFHRRQETKVCGNGARQRVVLQPHVPQRGKYSNALRNGAPERVRLNLETEHSRQLLDRLGNGPRELVFLHPEVLQAGEESQVLADGSGQLVVKGPPGGQGRWPHSTEIVVKGHHAGELVPVALEVDQWHLAQDWYRPREFVFEEKETGHLRGKCHSVGNRSGHGIGSDVEFFHDAHVVEKVGGNGATEFVVLQSQRLERPERVAQGSLEGVVGQVENFQFRQCREFRDDRSHQVLVGKNDRGDRQSGISCSGIDNGCTAGDSSPLAFVRTTQPAVGGNQVIDDLTSGKFRGIGKLTGILLAPVPCTL
mmetsp:Transcript_23392/g.55118  ORF Transcript_23392/g.55118 Transcript_23392/m.55118 type:complete len:400 (-) Transcript_23392:2767-3966(-)